MNHWLIAIVIAIVVLVIIGIYMYMKSPPPNILSNDPPTTGTAGTICQNWAIIYPHLSYFIDQVGNMMDSFQGLNTDFSKTTNETILTKAGYGSSSTPIIIAHVAPGSGTNSVYTEMVVPYTAAQPVYESLNNTFTSLAASIAKYSISAEYPSATQLALDIADLKTLLNILPTASSAQWYVSKGSLKNVPISTAWTAGTANLLMTSTGDSSKFGVLWVFIATCYYMMNSTVVLADSESWLNGDSSSKTPATQGWVGMKKILEAASGLTPYNGTSSGRTFLDCYNVLANNISDSIFMPLVSDIATNSTAAYSAIAAVLQ